MSKLSTLLARPRPDGSYRGVAVDEPEDEVTATETPRALIESRTVGAPKAKRSGEYVVAEFNAAVKSSSTVKP